MATAQRVSGARIKEARLKAGMSQAQLAYAIQTGERNIRRWENESHSPRVDAVAAIAEVTGFDLAFFLRVESREAAPVGDPFRGHGRGVAVARNGASPRKGDPR